MIELTEWEKIGFTTVSICARICFKYQRMFSLTKNRLQIFRKSCTRLQDRALIIQLWLVLLLVSLIAFVKKCKDCKRKRMWKDAKLRKHAQSNGIYSKIRFVYLTIVLIHYSSLESREILDRTQASYDSMVSTKNPDVLETCAVQVSY